MNCWHCDRPAHAVCIFCGRAVCKEHAKKLPNILGVYKSEGEEMKVIAVDDAIFCGQCRPRDNPVTLGPMQ